MSSILILQTNLEGLNQTLYSLQGVEKSRELSLAITKVEEAIMWLEKAEYLAHPTLFDNVPTQENPNQGMLNFDAPAEEAKPKATRKKAEPRVEKVILTGNPNVVGLVVEDTQPVEMKCPPVDDVRMAFKKYVETNGTENGNAALIKHGAEKISELYAKGDNVVINFYNSIV
jgi:hypothetical protein